MNGASNETRTHSCRLTSLACKQHRLLFCMGSGMIIMTPKQLPISIKYKLKNQLLIE